MRVGVCCVGRTVQDSGSGVNVPGGARWPGEGRGRSSPGQLPLFLEAYYGENDPQLSGEAPAYGHDSDTTDWRVDLRSYCNLEIVKATAGNRWAAGADHRTARRAIRFGGAA